MMPAATSCSLYSPIARSSSAEGMRPASVASLAFTSTITFITALPIRARRGPFHPATVGGGGNRHRRRSWIQHARAHAFHPCDPACLCDAALESPVHFLSQQPPSPVLTTLHRPDISP